MSNNLQINNIEIRELKPSLYNPRRWSDEATKQLSESIKRFGLVDPIIVNSAPARKNVVIGGHFRLKVAEDLNYAEIPVVYVNIPDEAKEKELNLRLNHNLGDWDWELLAEFDESLLADIGFTSEELDTIFDLDDVIPEEFDLQKELEKLKIDQIKAQKDDIYKLGDSRLMVGDSTIEANVIKLMNGEQADMCLTDPPYLLDYLNAKRHGKPTEGFGAKRNRRYLETDVLPDNFTELWMANVAKVAKPDFSIIVYENWKNVRTIWSGLEANGWTVHNMLIWHLKDRHQGFAARSKFFNKFDIAMLGTGGSINLNLKDESSLLRQEYETALFAISGHPHWESYGKGKKYVPTDFIEFNAADEKSSGQGVIFGVKPIEILIPYIKVLTKRGDLVVEPFGGSGSTLIAATKLKRRCYLLEKSHVYSEVIMNRWEKLTGLKREKLS